MQELKTIAFLIKNKTVAIFYIMYCLQANEKSQSTTVIMCISCKNTLDQVAIFSIRRSSLVVE